MIFKDFLNNSAPRIDTSLATVLDTWQKAIAVTSPELSPLLISFSQGCRGGKRIRGVLVEVGYVLAGGDKPSTVMSASVALEIFRSAILAHDDIIDQSLIRRGKPSLYQALGGDHYAISQTISLGDIGFFKAIELLSQLPVSSEIKIQAVEYFSQQMQQTALGEMFDVYLPIKKSYSEEDIIHLASLKTASYTFMAPLGLGVILGGGEEQLRKRIEEFASFLGIAYQLHDDWLGIYGHEDELGKSTISDIKEGKVTLLIAYAMKKGTPSQKERLALLYGNRDITLNEAREVRSIFQEIGADRYVQEMAEEYLNHARALVSKVTDKKQLQELCYSLIEYLLTRKK